MNIVVLTSSRADYGIYRPLLIRLKKDSFFNLKIVAFGTHLSRFHGYTINNIKQDGFEVFEKLETLILGDSPTAISNAIGNTITKFSSFWGRLQNEIDLVMCLGDRYEMFAAVAATIPFNIKIAHIHGGETTLGAIDNKFRHAITLMSNIHFVTTEIFKNKVIELTGESEHVYNVGSISLDNLLDLELYSKKKFRDVFGIDLNHPTILTTFHPETVSFEKNEDYAQKLVSTLEILAKEYQIVITMPNADTMGNMIRQYLNDLSRKNECIICVENFGTLGYFSCIRHCSFLLGNTSSGIIEAASFQKFVINIGDRQKGRARSENVIDAEVNANLILKAVDKIKNKIFTGKNIYHQPNSSNNILKILKAI